MKNRERMQQEIVDAMVGISPEDKEKIWEAITEDAVIRGITAKTEQEVEYLAAIIKADGVCAACGGRMDRYGLICKYCLNDGPTAELPWVEREAMKAAERVRANELRDVSNGS